MTYNTVMPDWRPFPGFEPRIASATWLGATDSSLWLFFYYRSASALVRVLLPRDFPEFICEAVELEGLPPVAAFNSLCAIDKRLVLRTRSESGVEAFGFHCVRHSPRVEVARVGLENARELFPAEIGEDERRGGALDDFSLTLPISAWDAWGLGAVRENG